MSFWTACGVLISEELTQMTFHPNQRLEWTRNDFVVDEVSAKICRAGGKHHQSQLKENDEPRSSQ
jgi:hypothetical protein